MRTFIAFGLLLVASMVFAQDPFYPPPPTQRLDNDLIQRQLDLEARQLVLERKLKDLEELLMRQQQGLETLEPTHTSKYRMSPRHIEIIKKQPQSLEIAPTIPYPMYRIAP